MNRAQIHSRPARTARSKRKRILFIIATLGLVMLFAELSLHIFYRASVGRWLWEWWAIPIFEDDPVRVYRVKANLDYLHRTSEFTARYCTDESGMRTDCGEKGPLLIKSDDTFRVLALGPSFVFGWGVNYDESYMHRIAKGLRIPGKRVELINLGTPSQPLPYQLKWLKAVGHRYQPDLIVQTVYGDIQHLDRDDTLPEKRPYVRRGYLYLSDKTAFALWIGRVRRYSTVLFYGWHVYHAARSSHVVQGDGREFYRKTASQSTAPDEQLRRYQGYIEFVHGAMTNKPQIVFVFVPMAHIVRPADVTRVAHHGDIPNPFEVRENAALLTGILGSNHVNMINPTDVLVENDKSTRMYNLYDIHFTSAGNKVVADHALPRIQQVLDLSGGR